MVSLQLLNAFLNFMLWTSNGIISRFLESIYVSVAKLQVKFTGKTRATDSSETNVFQWVPGRTGACAANAYQNRTRTATWVFALLLFSLSFIPAEVLVESGIDKRDDCGPTVVEQKGVCASPWKGHSDTGIACSALLVDSYTWADQDWDVVYEGSSPSMFSREVHVARKVANLPESATGSRIPLASGCSVQVSGCGECGTLTVERDQGAFDTIITNASLAREAFSMDEDDIAKRCPHTVDISRKFAPYRGDLTYDFNTGLAFFFWAQPCKNIPSDRSHTWYKLHARGVEALLSEEEISRVLKGSEEPWEIVLSEERTRVYDVSCESPGLGWKDLMKAISIYRTIQMERPGLQRTEGTGLQQRVPPMTSSDVLKALFALKAEDVRSKQCIRQVPVYQQCGAFEWPKALPFLLLTVLTMLMALSLQVFSIASASLPVPHNSESWRRVATTKEGFRSFRLQVKSADGIDDIFITLPEDN